jgi:hypothetical protein
VWKKVYEIRRKKKAMEERKGDGKTVKGGGARYREDEREERSMKLWNRRI